MATQNQSHYGVRSTATKTNNVCVKLHDLEGWCREMLSAAGFQGAQAELVAKSLTDAEARGVSSHGVSRVRIYAQRIQGGMLNADAKPVVVKETAATAHLDASNAVGHAGAFAGLEAAMGKAAEVGVGVSVVRNSNHCGTLGFYSRIAAERGLVTILMTNGPPVMVYYGGRSRAVGTNPFGIGVPRAGGAPLVLDMATSATARGKIILAGQKGQQIPEGWAVDLHGRPTTDPAAALEGSVVPFAGPKGSGLAMMVDLLCGGMAAAITGEDIGDMYEQWDREQRVSHFMLAMDPDSWHGGDAFRAHVARFAERVAGLPTAEGFDRVMLPGEVEQLAYDSAVADGVVLSGQVFEDLRTFASDLHVPVPDVEDVNDNHTNH